MSIVVCGIDPGLARTGYAVLRVEGGNHSILEAGVFRLNDDDPLEERLVPLDHDVTAILTEHGPTVVAVEELYSHYKHPKTAVLMGHARGVILLAAAKLGLRIQSYSPTQIKRFVTGNGLATKLQIQQAIQKVFHLPALPEPPDVADALAIAFCCGNDESRREMAESPR
ncbi:MAG: crossover junction endodeoxyribonuclease RuvC [Planctomycetota bacterium]